MRNLLLIFSLFLIPFCSFSSEKKTVYLFDIEGTIDPTATLKTTKAFDQAKNKKADLILLKLNTFGGTLDDADKIRTQILQSEIPVWVFIENNAASAGALISIACERIYMRSGSSIGAATVVNQTGEVQPDKFQAYMRSKMKATAEATGRNPEIAEAMVGSIHSIPGIIDSGKVLTFTTSEAIKHGYCQAQAENIKEALFEGGIDSYQIIEQRFSVIEKIVGFLVSPVVSGILLIIIVLGLYFEFQTPGVGFPLLAAIIAAVFYFAPLYLEGLAEHWEILLFIAGLGLIALEIFVIPGFGVPGIAGIILVIGGLVLSLVGNIGFNFSGVDIMDVSRSLLTVFLAFCIAIVLSLWLSKYILVNNTFGSLALDTVQNTSDGYTVADNEYQKIIGKTGITLTVLRPSGKIEVEGEMYDALSYAQFIEKGTKIQVIGYENTNAIVKKTMD